MNTKVMIATPTTEGIRNASFIDYRDNLIKPMGSVISSIHAQSPALSRNLMIQKALEWKCTHIFFLDDDTAPYPDTLERLLVHDKDVVTALYLSRQYPHEPFIFDSVGADGYCNRRYLTDDVHGLIPVVNAGLGCVLIKIEVFKALQRPWVRLGELDPEQWCDDIGFFNRVRQAGFEMYCDTDATLGHMGTVCIRPHRINGKWYTSYAAYSNEVVTFPQLVPDVDIGRARSIPGWMTDKELTFLARAAKQCKTIVEVGTFYGRSARAMADNTKGILFCVDPWEGALLDAEGEVIYTPDANIYEDFKHNLRDHIRESKVIPLKMTFDKVNINGYRPDFVFIDADHQYDSVRHDVLKALSMKPKMIAGHDYSEIWPGVVAAVDEIFGNKVQVEDTIWYVDLEGEANGRQQPESF